MLFRSLVFAENPDILANVAKNVKNGKPYCVGFAAETHDLEKHAQEKRVRKGIPLLVGNIGPETFGSDDNELLLVEENETTTTGKADKLSLARQLIQHISKRIPS